MSDSDQSLRIDEPLDALLLMVLKHWALSGHSLLLPCSPLQQLAQTPRVRSSSIRWKAQEMTGMYMGMLCQTTKLCTTCRSGTLLQTYAEQWHTSHTVYQIRSATLCQAQSRALWHQSVPCSGPVSATHR
jgi:hypothetical protein